MLGKIISGGQTGVDRAALDAALELGRACGGSCPRGRRAEDGRIPDRYPLTELESGEYADRTLRNVLDSDATLIVFFSALSGGTALTQRLCIEHGKPYALVDADDLPVERAIEVARRFVARHAVETLNVAGPRASGSDRAYDYAFRLVRGLLEGAPA